MNYIQQIHVLLDTFSEKKFFIVNKISKIIKNDVVFSVRANQNFLFDRKYPTKNSYYFPKEGKIFKDFSELYSYLEQLANTNIGDMLRNPDPNRHKIVINIPESEEHLAHLYSLENDESYKFLNAQFLSRPAMRGGYHARTTMYIEFGTPYALQATTRIIKSDVLASNLEKHVDKIKKELENRLELVNYAFEYIGDSYQSDTHKISNKSEVMKYIGFLKNAVDNLSTDGIIQNGNTYVDDLLGPILYKQRLGIGIMYKNESDLLHFIFLKDHLHINFSQTVIFRPLEETK